MSTELVTVVIPVYNAAETIRGVLEALEHQTYPRCQVVVVDDGSTDQTPEIVRRFSFVEYIRQQNAGPAAARNRGARAARGGVIFFTDADCVPEEDWIARMMPFFADARIGVVAGSYGIANPGSLLARCVHREILFRHQRLMPLYPKVFGSYNFAIRKDLFFELKGFKETYRRASGEDNDLSYRVIRAGARIYFCREARVRHFHPVCLRRYLAEQYRHGLWRALLYRDHSLRVASDGYTFWKDVVEVGLVGLTTVGLVGVFWGGGILALVALGFLIGLELFYGCRVGRDWPEKIYLSWVMFLRAFARTLGFSSGTFLFPWKKPRAKKLNKCCNTKCL